MLITFPFTFSYCSTLSCYLMFKAKRANLKLHPLTGRMLQYKQIIDKMEEGEMDKRALEQAAAVIRDTEAGLTIKEQVNAAKRRSAKQK